MIEMIRSKWFSRSQMISSWRRTRRWFSPYPPGRSQMASLSLMTQVKFRGVMPRAHFPRSFGGIRVSSRSWPFVSATLRTGRQRN